MRKTFVALAFLLLVIVLAQFFFAAAGAFGTAPREDSYRPHHVLGYVIFLVPVGMMIVAALGRLPGRFVGMPALVTGLTTVQVLIAKLAQSIDGTAGHYIFGLHAIGGLAILGVTGMIVRQARELSRSAQFLPKVGVR